MLCLQEDRDVLISEANRRRSEAEAALASVRYRMDSEISKAKSQKEARASVLKRELETDKARMEAEVTLIKQEADAEVAVAKAEMETMQSKFKVQHTDMYNSMRSVVAQAAETPAAPPQERDNNSYLVGRLAASENATDQAPASLAPSPSPQQDMGRESRPRRAPSLSLPPLQAHNAQRVLSDDTKAAWAAADAS